MIVATFNAASIRARLSLTLEWLAENGPDVLALQETKVEDEKFPISDFEELGYHVALNGQKSWNGVALLSRSPILAVTKGFGDELFPDDARIISGEIDGVQFINTYVPNGQSVTSEKFEYKLKWLDRFHTFLHQNFSPDQPLIWLGDINIAPGKDDVYDSHRKLGVVGHHPLEFAALDKVLSFGLADVYRMFHQGPGHYTYWDFVIPNAVQRNLGWRIDHIYATRPLAAKAADSRIDRQARLQNKPSDHTFVVAEFDL